MDLFIDGYMAEASGLEVGELDCLLRLLQMLAADLPPLEADNERQWVMAGELAPLAVGAAA